MNGLEGLTLILQGAVPLGLILLTARKHPSLLGWGLWTTCAGAYILAIGLAAPWLALPSSMPWLYAGLLAVAAYVGRRRSLESPRLPGGVGARSAVAAAGVGALALLGLSLYAAAGRQERPAVAVDLAFPLHGGTYLVAAGGGNELVNPHLKTRDAARYPRYVGQTYAVDLVRVGAWGSRASAFSPDDPTGFAIFGEAVTAPCTGTVIAAVDGHPDRLGPGEGPENLEGNHVILSCGDAWIVMAHLARGSVFVSEGERVRVGDPIGLVGNSGRSDEPHLHIHAQRPGSRAAPLGGRPIPITFEGRYLVRNDRVRAVPTK